MIFDTLFLHVPVYSLLVVLDVEVVFITVRCVTHSFSGGSPYPRLKGQEIAQMLQGGHRMPKPQHVGQRL